MSIDSPIGKKFKSKINGMCFRVIELRTDNKQQYYVIEALSNGNLLRADKRVFEEMCLANLEEIEG